MLTNLPHCGMFGFPGIQQYSELVIWFCSSINLQIYLEQYIFLYNMLFICIHKRYENNIKDLCRKQNFSSLNGYVHPFPFNKTNIIKSQYA